MSQVDIQTDTEGRIIGLSGNFTKWTNSNGEEDHFAPDAVTITVPENMEAHVSASMTVDDWGYIDITPLSGGGSTIRAINLTTEVASPGPRGGHVRWSGQTNEAIVLQPGQYSIIIRQDNAPYGEAYASEAGTNVSFCQASVTIEYIAILSPVIMNPLTQSDANTLMNAYNTYNYKNVTSHYPIWVSAGLENDYGTTDDKLGTASCALRASLAFCDYGVALPEETGIGCTNKSGQNVFVRAANMHAYLEEILVNAPMFTGENAAADFMKHLNDNNATAVIIWTVRSEKQGRITHVGMGYQNEGCAAEGTFNQATSIWVLNSSAYTDPSESIAPFTR